MKIELDEVTCPVCGTEHSDHIINGEASWLVWEDTICNACDEWYLRLETDVIDDISESLATTQADVDAALAIVEGFNGPAVMRGRN